MFSPLENEESEDWFQRLNAPLKRLPTGERTEIHQEVRQHLEALAAANEELGSSPEEAWNHALKQFGDPNKFGEKMAQEWQQGRTGLRADMQVILFGSVLQVLGCFLTNVANQLWFNRFYNPSDSLYAHGHDITGLPLVARVLLSFGLPPLVGVAVGLKYPMLALKGAFYAYIFGNLCAWLLPALLLTARQITFSGPPLPLLIRFLFVLMPSWMVCHVTASYLASVTKRGWYRPSWADFKITLPKRRRQVN